jgi:hypothetical protein
MPKGVEKEAKGKGAKGEKGAGKAKPVSVRVCVPAGKLLVDVAASLISLEQSDHRAKRRPVKRRAERSRAHLLPINQEMLRYLLTKQRWCF